MNNYYPTLDIGKVIQREFSKTQILQDVQLRKKYDEYHDTCLNNGIQPYSFDRRLMELWGNKYE
jgi:hypothetical protein